MHRVTDLPYHPYSLELSRHFPRPVRKLCIDAGFGCPNRDSRRDHPGCIFCNNDAFTTGIPGASVEEQLRFGLGRLSRQVNQPDALVYLQNFTNTHAPVEELRALYTSILASPHVVGLAIGTRPDCVPDPVLDLLAELAVGRYLLLELGLPSSRDETLAFLQRGHDAGCFAEAVGRARARGLRVCGHMMTGLPGEGEAEAVSTARFLVEAGVSGLKIHNLHIVRDTELARMHGEEPIRLLSMEEHAGLVVGILEWVPQGVVVHRLWGFAQRGYLVAPEWCRHGGRIREAILEEFSRRGSWQGKALGEPCRFFPETA